MWVARAVNWVARGFLVFIIAYLWLSFYIRPLSLVFLFSFLIAFAVSWVFEWIYIKRHPVVPRIRYIKPVGPYAVALKAYRRDLKRRGRNFRRSLRALCDVVFSKKRVKPYIFYGVVLVLTSFLVKFSIYYVVFSTILFAFALISFIYNDTIKA